MSKANDARYATQTSLPQSMKDTYIVNIAYIQYAAGTHFLCEVCRNLHSTVRIRAAQHNQIGGHA